jgi:di/tricarboxylate transporter
MEDATVARSPRRIVVVVVVVVVVVAMWMHDDADDDDALDVDAIVRVNALASERARVAARDMV